MYHGYVWDAIFHIGIPNREKPELAIKAEKVFLGSNLNLAYLVHVVSDGDGLFHHDFAESLFPVRLIREHPSDACLGV